MDWQAQGACLEEDPDLFFPTGSTGPIHLEIERAKTVCRRCPVADDCLAWAVSTGQRSGIWGGMSEDERRRWARNGAA